VPIIYFFFPETKGLELEDVDRLFAKPGSGVARSMSLAAVEERMEEKNIVVHNERLENV
jgi:hypothetical protein